MKHIARVIGLLLGMSLVIGLLRAGTPVSRAATVGQVVLATTHVALADAGAPRKREWAVFNLDGEITGGEAARLAELLVWARRGAAEGLEIRIDSGGGLGTEAIKLYEVVRTAGIPTRCVVGKGAKAMSGAFLVLQACEMRVASRDAVLMTHRPRRLVILPEGMRIAVLTVEELDRLASETRLFAAMFDGLIAARLGMAPDAYRAKVANGQDWRMTGVQALAAHAIDALVLD